MIIGVLVIAMVFGMVVWISMQVVTIIYLMIFDNINKFDENIKVRRTVRIAGIAVGLILFVVIDHHIHADQKENYIENLLLPSVFNRNAR